MSKKGISITISTWRGEFGNNIFQILTAIHFVEYTGGHVVFQDLHLKLCLPKRIRVSKNENLQDDGENRQIPNFSNWFTLGSLQKAIDRADGEISKLPPGFENNRLLAFRKNALHYVKELVEFSINYENKIDNKKFYHPAPDELCVHVRSGDIQCGSVGSGFIQAPFSFFEKVIKDRPYKKITLVSSQDHPSPIIPKIKDYCSKNNISFSQSEGDFWEDVYILLNASNLMITGHTSFSRSIVMCSTQIKKLYLPNLRKNLIDTVVFADYAEFDVTIYKVNDYMDSWDYQQYTTKWVHHPIEKIELEISSSGDPSSGLEIEYDSSTQD